MQNSAATQLKQAGNLETLKVYMHGTSYGKITSGGLLGNYR
jgi:hypothetical protein